MLINHPNKFGEPPLIKAAKYPKILIIDITISQKEVLAFKLELFLK